MKLVLHAHRAGHAAFTKGNNGISMMVIAKLSRLVGMDHRLSHRGYESVGLASLLPSADERQDFHQKGT